jgi:AcrR family transcriptional regulator
LKRSAEERWVVAGLEALVSDGIQAVRVEALARALGLTKGSFYHHFKNRKELLGRMVAYWRERGTEVLIVHADREQDAAARFTQLSKMIFTPTEMDGLEVAIRAWAASDEDVAEVVAQVDTTRLVYVRDLFIEMGMEPDAARIRSEVFYRVVIGDFMWRSVGKETLGTAALGELLALFLASEQRDDSSQK